MIFSKLLSATRIHKVPCQLLEDIQIIKEDYSESYCKHLTGNGKYFSRVCSRDARSKRCPGKF